MNRQEIAKAPSFVGFKASDIPLTNDWGVVRYTAIDNGYAYWYMYHSCGALVRNDLKVGAGRLECRKCGVETPIEVAGYFEVCKW